MSASQFLTTPLLSLHRLGWIGLGDSRVFLADALGGFHSLREQIAQEIGEEAEAEMVQRAGFASAERLVMAARDSGDLTPDEAGFHNALALISSAGYGQFRAVEVRFAEQWARVVAENSIEGWMFRETASRPSASCDFMRGLLAGVMHYLAQSNSEDDSAADLDTAGAFGSEEAPVAEILNGLEISCIETACIAAGEETCQFVLGPSHLLLAEGLNPAPMSQSSVRETLLRLNRQLEQILDSSRKDPLTKLYNRSFFEQALRQRIGYAKRRSDVVSLGIIDIDSFKTINDTHGHMVGDRVLRQIARTLEQQARDNDIVSRLGGDEFVWLMPATPGEAALSVAQRLRRTVEELSPGIGFNVSISIGVANYPQDASTPGELFEHADMALFAAKRAGRDQAIRYSAGPGSGTNGNGPASGLNRAPATAQPEPHFAATPTLPASEHGAGNPGRTRSAGGRGVVKPRRDAALIEQEPPQVVAPPPVEGKTGRSRTGNGRDVARETDLDQAAKEAFPEPGGTRRYGKKVRY